MYTLSGRSYPMNVIFSIFVWARVRGGRDSLGYGIGRGQSRGFKFLGVYIVLR